MAWWLLQLIAAVVGSATSILDKKLVTQQDSAVRWQISSFVVVALPLALNVGFSPFPSVVLVGQMILAGILYISAVWLYFHWLHYEQVTVISLFLRLITPFTAIVAYFNLGEALSVLQLVAILVSMVGAFLLTIPSYDSTRSHSTILSFASGCGVVALLTVVSVLTAPAYRTLPVHHALGWECVGQVIGGLAILLLTRTPQSVSPKTPTLWAILLLEQVIRMLLALLNGMIVAQDIPLAVISSASFIRTIFVLLLAAFVLKERWPRSELPQRLMGSSAIVVGFVLLKWSTA